MGDPKLAWCTNFKDMGVETPQIMEMQDKSI
jgi:hypothetical protein